MLVEVCAHIEGINEIKRPKVGLRAVRADRIAMGAPANLPGVWRHTLL